ncbi:MAG: hypothetical protein NZ653_04650 [Anaerolineae bacterium]|nr:hypothetical protein [Anaerolineae bacterium]
MGVPLSFFRQLDRRAFLGFKVWEFSFRSLSRPYGLWFLKHVVLRHPLATLRGLLKYRKLVKRNLLDRAVNFLGSDSPEDFFRDQKNLIIAPGYCQKPFNCPAGRFSPSCLLPQSCFEFCSIKNLISAGLKLGAKVYVMTSALRIGQDLLLPALEGKGPSRILAFVCPYSLHPFALACLICGLRGFILTFAEGACSDYEAWLMADKGVKPEQTAVSREGEEFLRNFSLET